MALESDSSENGPLSEGHGVASPSRASSTTVKRKLEESLCSERRGARNMKRNGVCREAQPGPSERTVLPAGGVSENIFSAQVGGSGPAKDPPVPLLPPYSQSPPGKPTASWSNGRAPHPNGLSSRPRSWCVNFRVKLCTGLGGLNS